MSLNMVWMNPCGYPQPLRSAQGSGVRFIFQYVGVLALFPQLDLPDDPRLERTFCLANILILRPVGRKCKPGDLPGVQMGFEGYGLQPYIAGPMKVRALAPEDTGYLGRG